jgi:hypothetical protein
MPSPPFRAEREQPSVNFQEKKMIEIIQGLPDNVVGIVVKGRLTKSDCTEILLPRLKKSLEWHYKLRLYYEIRSRFPGAAWDEIDLGLEHLPQWERVAVVTDVACIRHAIQALRLLIPGEIRAFATSQTPEGLAWITDTPVHKRPLVAVPAVSPLNGRGRSFRPPVQYLHRDLHGSP